MTADEAKKLARSVNIRREYTERLIEKIEKLIKEAALQGDFSIDVTAEDQYMGDTVVSEFSSRGFFVERLSDREFTLSWDEEDF